MFKNMNFIKDFGAVKDGSLALTLGGQVAVKNGEGQFVRYNTADKTIENQMEFVLKDAMGMLFILPVQVVFEGDVIKYKDSYYQVLSISDKGIKAANLKTGTTTTIIKEVNVLFNMSFYYKVVSPFSAEGFNNQTVNGINPMMLMLLNDDADSDMLPLLLLSGAMMPQATGEDGEAPAQQPFNPMMLMLLAGKEGKGNLDMKDMLMFSMLGGQQGTAMNPLMLMALLK